MTTESLPAQPKKGYGPSALATPANAVTIARVVVSPFMLALIIARGASWPSVAAWIVLAGTDGIDGYLARRHGTTRSGAFLDPLADKVLVLGAMVSLVVKGLFWWLPVVIIGVREVGISVYRGAAGRRGISVPARPLAKLKTVVQAFAVGFALLPWTADHRLVANSFLWFAVALTVVSGVQYVLDAGKVARAV
jgi:CDP-diacylglycerol---glycerol-3-phosphate 3-phosphatidyltransferase